MIGARADDLMYVGGVLVTLQSLLERIEQMHQERVMVGGHAAGYRLMAGGLQLLERTEQTHQRGPALVGGHS